MDQETIVYKTKPGFIFIILMLLGAFFFAFMAKLMWTSNPDVHNTSKQEAKAVVLVFQCSFMALSLVCLWLVLAFKIICLTHNDLIISKPILFYKRIIHLADIGQMKEQEENINIERGLSYNKIAIGNKATFQLSDGKKLRISSIEISGYHNLINKLNTQIRINKDRRIK